MSPISSTFRKNSKSQFCSETTSIGIRGRRPTSKLGHDTSTWDGTCASLRHRRAYLQTVPAVPAPAEPNRTRHRATRPNGRRSESGGVQVYLRWPSLYRSSTTRPSMTGGSRSSDNTASLLNHTKPTNREPNREPSREPNREPRRKQNRGPNIGKPGSSTNENHRLSKRIHRLELNLGAVNHNNRELRNQAQSDTIRGLNAQLKTEKNKARDVEAQLRAAEWDRAELAKYWNAERSGTRGGNFHFKT
jgi:hypothetical protein